MVFFLIFAVYFDTAPLTWFRKGWSAMFLFFFCRDCMELGASGQGMSAAFAWRSRCMAGTWTCGDMSRGVAFGFYGPYIIMESLPISQRARNTYNLLEA